MVEEENGKINGQTNGHEQMQLDGGTEITAETLNHYQRWEQSCPSPNNFKLKIGFQ